MYGGGGVEFHEPRDSLAFKAPTNAGVGALREAAEETWPWLLKEVGLSFSGMGLWLVGVVARPMEVTIPTGLPVT